MKTIDQLIRIQHKSLLSLMAVLAISCTSNVRAEITQCTEITSIPTVITEQGIYCLKNNLASSETNIKAIDIQTSNVTIDFNEFKLGGLAAGANTQSTGIYAMGRKNIILRNGNIRGFQTGLLLEAPSGDISPGGGHVVENNRFDSNKRVAVNVEGIGNVIRGNIINATGGSTAELAFGMLVTGPGMEVVNNKINGTHSEGSVSSASGIFMDDAEGAIVKYNHISNTISEGDSFGIIMDGGDQILLQGNVVINSDQQGSIGISNEGAASAVCRDNTILNFSNGLIDCINSVGNVVLGENVPVSR